MPDTLAPASCRVARKVDASPGALWSFHRRLLDEDAAKGGQPVPVGTDADAVRELVESHHKLVSDFHVARG